MADTFSHLNEKGEASMVDVGGKPDQKRMARASGKIFLQPQTLKLIKAGSIEKGDIFAVARIAGIQAAKNTFTLIPLCHQVPLSKVSVDFEMEDDGIRTTAIAKCTGKTGVEMEALTAVNVALLTIYDMCKAVDKQMVMSEIKLLEKHKK
ncbi:cyclic pyranopterin monophosphate synthase MoaC [Mariniphaga sediminis]|jgi:cyclic pyranopterin phosphate synthase|uniref:cyclic pyranopterin monophosphate synthase MoaC n=1 Tax=Mariniphaga sediminis TaxID=1628158 RepID=UPI003562BEF5